MRVIYSETCGMSKEEIVCVYVCVCVWVLMWEDHSRDCLSIAVVCVVCV